MNIYLVIGITLLFSAFFSGMEMAFISANKLRIEIDKKQGLFSSRILSVFINQPSQYITTMLLGNNVALVIYGLYMATALEPFISNYISQNSIIILLIQTTISTLIILVTAEFLPKTIFRSVSNPALNILSLPLFIFYSLFFPAAWVINQISNLFIFLFKKKDEQASNMKSIIGKVDLAYLINESTTTETLEPELTEEGDENDVRLFQNALDFTSVKVRECMVPRTEIEAIDIKSSFEELKKVFINTGLSKVLVYDDDVENIIGYVTSKLIFRKPDSIAENVIEIMFVPETMAANKLLKKFIQQKKNIAVVVDEFGGISGMLTIEDIIEEIFGEIEDEFDNSGLVEKKVNEAEFILSGRLEIDYLNEKYGLSLKTSEDYETIAGLIISHHKDIPEQNEIIQIDNFEFRILKVSQIKIELLQLKVV